uniref:Uncharacterized protein LOC111134006 n=1 Tax=Crassostrea virginica TaxID=6565 RepID=A0A8B8EG64_CRAVI|nr:uncharacterized protein LOC111134006 [Crassostrea virginica]XP_022338477.1 uncharacterized protein LOC111134006 [Crassostrea virginica]XP_022338478.1 uncharacterized protein LOC111134006 [Crassostrea virginica]XP_022338479.1 uncharacterized protein LOC111134006 [Crassostrea virginica]
MDVSAKISGEDLSEAYNFADVIGSISVVLPVAVYILVSIILAVRGKGVSQETLLFQLEEEEEDFERGDLNNNKTEFTVDSNDREFTSYQCKNHHNFKTDSCAFNQISASCVSTKSQF